MPIFNFRSVVTNYFDRMHHLYELLQRKTGIPLRELIGLSVVSGLLRTGLLAVTSAAVGASVTPQGWIGYFIIFVVMFIFWLYSERRLHYRAIEAMQTVVHRIRLRVARRLNETDLRSYEQAGHMEFFSHFTYDTEVISESTHQLIHALGSVVVSLGCLAYLTYLSPVAGGFTAAALALGFLIYYSSFPLLRRLVDATRTSEKELHGAIKHVLYGFKELRINDAKSDDFFHHSYRPKASELRRHKQRGAILHTQNHVLITLLWYGIAAFVGVVFSQLFAQPPEVVLLLLAAILFLPMEALLFAVPFLNRAAVSVERLHLLEQLLESISPDMAPRRAAAEAAAADAKPAAGMGEPLRELSALGVSFAYEMQNGDEETFRLGPLDFSVRPGKVLFIAGGNGAGKSTLVKLLVGLYRPGEGGFLVNGEPADLTERAHLFSAVFTDCHIFDRLYGQDQVDGARVRELLKEFYLTGHTDYVDGRFTSLDLSTGQRKRLALVEALADDSPILVLDEPAAEQDPAFRKKFYRQILPDLRRQGRAVVVITHDYHYFDAADELLWLDYGRFAPLPTEFGGKQN